LAIAATAMTSVAGADEADMDASATFVAPVSIQAGEPLEFGQVSIPASGECAYEIAPDGGVSATGAAGCGHVSGATYPARFEVSCGQTGAAVRYEITFLNAAPTGSVFEAPNAPVRIDGAPAGGLSQVRPCDGDGVSAVAIGGRLRVSASAPSGFAGRVGTIRLEANFE
jgi:hypothetical protein